MRVSCCWSSTSIYTLTAQSIFQGKVCVFSLSNGSLSHSMPIFPGLESALQKLQRSEVMKCEWRGEGRPPAMLERCTAHRNLSRSASSISGCRADSAAETAAASRGGFSTLPVDTSLSFLGLLKRVLWTNLLSLSFQGVETTKPFLTSAEGSFCINTLGCQGRS